jgi:PAS domain S-box-containing protein
MSTTPLAGLLVVDDEAPQMKALCDTLHSAGYHTTGFTSASQALAAMRERSFDVVLSDLMMPEMDGIAFLDEAFSIDPNLAGIIMTGHGTVQTAVDALKGGALDYILKPFRLSAILPVLTRALEVRRLRMENIQLKEAVALHELSTAMALAPDFQTVLHTLADAAFEQSRASSLAILLPNEDQSELYVAACRGEDCGRLRMARFPLSGAIADWVAHGRELRTHPDDGMGALRTLTPSLPELHSDIAVPLLSAGNLVGILSLTGHADPHKPATPGHLKALNILAATGASALEATLLLERLRAAEQRYRQLAENAPDIVFRYELDPEPRFVYVSPAATAITGYGPEEYYADPELSLKTVHPGDRAMLESVFRGGQPSGRMIALRCIHKSGSLVWLEQRTVLVHDRSGRLVALEGIARDVTERKKLEEQLRQSQKLEAIGQLTAGVAHDFNNLLTVINGYTDLTSKEIAPEDPAQRKINEVKKAGEQAAALTRQLLAFSRAQALDPQVVDLAEILRDMHQMIRRLIGDRIKVSTTIVSRVANVKLDPSQLQQVILNLAVNARDAMPKGGVLRFELRNVRFDSQTNPHPDLAAGNFVMLSVSDTGSGMTPEVKRRAFEPFFTTKEVGRGTGLGLATVYGIVKQSGGHVLLDSEPGKGTKFTIFFPEFAVPPETGETPAAAQSGVADAIPSSIRRVLIVDDEPAIRGLLAEVLRGAGFDVLTAQDGREALERAAQASVDLMITDLIMPEVEGIELIAMIRRQVPALKVIAMSGLFSADMLRAARLLGAQATLTKPLTGEMVLDCIRGITAGEQTFVKS